MKQALGCLITLAMLMLGAVAQQVQIPPPKPPAPPPQPTSKQSPSRENADRAFFLYGRLVMADGAPLPASVQVNMVCNGSIVRQVFASQNGSFTVEIGSKNNIGSSVIDASASGRDSIPLGNDQFGANSSTSSIPGSGMSAGLGRMDLSSCEFQVTSVPGYQADPVQLGRVSIFDSNIGDVFLRPMSGIKGLAVSAKTLQAPKAAASAFENARKELGKTKIDYPKAIKELEKAVSIYPGFTEAWNLLGNTRAAQNELAPAHEALQKAIDIEPNYYLPYLGMARIEFQQSRWAEAARLSDRVVELNPYVTEGRYLQALSNFQVGNYQVAEESIRAIRDTPSNPKLPLLHFVMGAILAKRGEYSNAAKEFTLFLGSPAAQDQEKLADVARTQLADWEKWGLIPPPE